jgi:hypothetical protein
MQSHRTHSDEGAARPQPSQQACAWAVVASTLICLLSSVPQVRAAYRRKGWALTNTDHVEQCKHDSYMESVREQTGAQGTQRAAPMVMFVTWLAGRG